MAGITAIPIEPLKIILWGSGKRRNAGGHTTADPKEPIFAPGLFRDHRDEGDKRSLATQEYQQFIAGREIIKFR
jgi:hypothetical protein